jgi:hypothetical protein
VFTGAEVNGEGDFLVGGEIPGGAVESVSVDGAEGEAFPGEAWSLPGDSVAVEGEEGMKAGKDQEAVGEYRADGDDGTEFKMDAGRE